MPTQTASRPLQAPLLKPLPLKIEGVGCYLPQRIVRNEELEQRCQLPTGWISKWMGVHERRWADHQRETNAFMGARAAEDALANAACDLTDIDLILNASGTHQHMLPENAPFIQEELGRAAHGIAAMSINATCLSFVVGLDTAASLLATGRYTRILIVSSDIASVGLNFEQPESAALFGDAAAAVVVSRSAPDESACLESAHFVTYSDGVRLTEIFAGASFEPSYHYDQDKHALYVFNMQGRKVLRLARKHLPSFLETLRTGLSQSLDGIDVVIPHQASRMGLKLAGGLKWSGEKIVQTLSSLGNTIAASIPLTLHEAIKTGQLKRGMRVLLVGTGAGLSIGGVILRY
ncbi:MAG: 3-oxoacyl-[acyl-carrier-protein] synthase III C-terminal domain-containing protein [Deinococcota bacterium]